MRVPNADGLEICIVALLRPVVRLAKVRPGSTVPRMTAFAARRAVVLKVAASRWFGAQLAGDLHEIQVAAPLARHRRVVDGLILLNPAIRSEEPDAVAQDRAAERESG